MLSMPASSVMRLTFFPIRRALEDTWTNRNRKPEETAILLDRGIFSRDSEGRAHLPLFEMNSSNRSSSGWENAAWCSIFPSGWGAWPGWRKIRGALWPLKFLKPRIPAKNPRNPSSRKFGITRAANRCPIWRMKKALLFICSNTGRVTRKTRIRVPENIPKKKQPSCWDCAR